MTQLALVLGLSPDVLPLPPPVVGDSEPRRWLLFFALTLLLESCACFLVWKVQGGPGRLRSWILAALVGSIVSFPIATAALVRFSTSRPITDLALYWTIEVGVVLLESVAYRAIAGCAWDRAWKVSLLVNAPTALLGFLLGDFSAF
jgi:hypothetical protein